MKYLSLAFTLILTLSVPIYAQNDKMDIYICIGQSNMAGRANIPQRQYFETSDSIFLLNSNEEMEIAQLPLNQYSNIRKNISLQKLGLSWSFAKNMVRKNKKPIGLVVNARGGSSIQEWSKGSYLYQKTMERIKNSQKYGKIKGILWHQGESNCIGTDKISANEYKILLRKLLEDLRKEFDNENLPIIIGELGQWGWAEQNDINEFNKMLNELANEMHFVACVSSDNLTAMLPGTCDPHFGTEAQLELGYRYFKALNNIIVSSNSTSTSCDHGIYVETYY